MKAHQLAEKYGERLTGALFYTYFISGNRSLRKITGTTHFAGKQKTLRFAWMSLDADWKFGILNPDDDVYLLFPIGTSPRTFNALIVQIAMAKFYWRTHEN